MKVTTSYSKTGERKHYISELIGDDYKNWSRRKIILTAPTGTGKSTFIVDTLLPYLKERGEKMLILCNRRLLRMQYWYDLVNKFNRYDELEASVVVMTYQELAENMKDEVQAGNLFHDFSVIVCDECHYFYSDSDFNAFGTYALLQIIIQEGITKEIIFMSATMDEVKSLIEQTIRHCFEKIRRKKNVRNWNDSRMREEIIPYDYSHMADYEKFLCYAIPDIESLCEMLTESLQKSVVFIDSKVKGQEMYERLVKIGKIECKDICVLNAENFDDAKLNGVIRHLTISHRLIPKILITTSVLDNGVSINDADVGNIVVITESKVSFLQMLGRIRTEKTERCNLYFLMRDEKIFCQRMNWLEKEMEKFKELRKSNPDNNRKSLFHIVWEQENEEMAHFYRKALVWMKRDYHFFMLPNVSARGVYGDEGFYINEFAERKTGDLYLAESRFYSLAMNNPVNVIYTQMEWIGKKPEELQILSSTYREERRYEFISFLLSVQNFTQDEIQEFKRKLVERYRNDFFSDVLSKNGTLSSEKMQMICKKYGLQYITHEDSERRRKLYSITR